jgi:hypothetical protein
LGLIPKQRKSVMQKRTINSVSIRGNFVAKWGLFAILYFTKLGKCQDIIKITIIVQNQVTAKILLQLFLG